MKIVNVTHGSFYAIGAYAAASMTAAWLARGYPPMLSYAVLVIAASPRGGALRLPHRARDPAARCTRATRS
jgi:branched-chain amino acid transport system permease protein